MTWIVEWKGQAYDVDPTEFDGYELGEIKKKAGFTYRQLLSAIGDLDGDAIRALFWTVDRRNDPELRFADYRGPALQVVLTQMEGLNAAMDELGKAIETTSESDGSDGSASSTDGAHLPDIEL